MGIIYLVGNVFIKDIDIIMYYDIYGLLLLYNDIILKIYIYILYIYKTRPMCNECAQLVY